MIYSPYLVLITAFISLVVWMTIVPKRNKKQEWFAITAIYATLFYAIYQDDNYIVASIGFIAGYLALCNRYYKGFIGL